MYEKPVMAGCWGAPVAGPMLPTAATGGIVEAERIRAARLPPISGKRENDFNRNLETNRQGRGRRPCPC
jgi:hypothetical protein